MPVHHYNIISHGGNSVAVALVTHNEQAPLLEKSTCDLRSSA
jgi:hypothetical protein